MALDLTKINWAKFFNDVDKDELEAFLKRYGINADFVERKVDDYIANAGCKWEAK